MQLKWLFPLRMIAAAAAPLVLLMGCSGSGTPTVSPAAFSLQTQASVAGQPGATVTTSGGTMPLGAAPAPVVTSSSVASPGGAMTLGVQTTAPVRQIFVGVQGEPGFITIDLGAARSRLTGTETYTVTLNLTAGTLPNPLVLIVETADLSGNVSQPALLTVAVLQGGSSSAFVGQYSGTFNGTILDNGAQQAINGPLSLVVDSTGALTATAAPTQTGQSPAVFTGAVSPAGVITATATTQGGGVLNLTGTLLAQGSGSGSITGAQVSQITWSTARVSTTASPGLFAGFFTGSFSGTTSQGSAMSGSMALTIDSSGHLTGTGTSTLPGQYPLVFVGTVTATGAVSAVATPTTPTGVQAPSITFTGAFQIVGSTATGTGSFSDGLGTTGTWSVRQRPPLP